MSDREFIVRLLRRTRRRLQMRSVLAHLMTSAGILLAVAVVVRWGGLSGVAPAKLRLETIALIVALAGSAVSLALQWKRKWTLPAAASLVDYRAGLSDQMKTAYWFAKQERVPSRLDPPLEVRRNPWIGLVMRRAARRAASIEVSVVVPWEVPRGFLPVLILLIVFVASHILPVPSPPVSVFSLTNPQTGSVGEAEETAERIHIAVQAMSDRGHSELARRLREALNHLEAGVSDPGLLSELQELQSLLDEANLELIALTEGIHVLSDILQTHESTRPASDFLRNQQPAGAAREFENLAEDWAGTRLSPRRTRELASVLATTAAQLDPGLEPLARNLQRASDRLQVENSRDAAAALQRVAQDLKDVEHDLQRHKLNIEAGQQLQRLLESIGRRSRRIQALTSESMPGSDGNQAADQQMASSSSGTTASSARRPGRMHTDEAAVGQGGASPSGAGAGQLDDQAATSLQVQLQKERLEGQRGPGTAEPAMESERKSSPEHSSVEFEEISSIAPHARRDVLSQQQIPLQYRDLIKNYFQTIQSDEQTPWQKRPKPSSNGK